NFSSKVQNPQKVPSAFRWFDGRTRIVLLFLNKKHFIILLHVIPKQTFSDSYSQRGKPRAYDIQCLLQHFSIHCFSHQHGYTEYIGIISIRYSVEYLSPIINPVPDVHPNPTAQYLYVTIIHIPKDKKTIMPYMSEHTHYKRSSRISLTVRTR